MKAKLRIFRLPRKTVFFIGGALLLGGATGAAALYVGKDGLLGFGASEKVDDLECTTVKTFKIKKKDRYWIRKFIKTEPAEGLARVMTALRVAEAVYAAQKPDLVQVVVLDQNGPVQRADMRGRAVGADVVYVPHPEKIPELQGTPVYTAKYVDGAANESGQFYGEKIQLPPEHIDSLVALLGDHNDCQDPAGVEVKDESGGHDTKKTEGHGAAPEENTTGEGHGVVEEPAGETPVAEGEHGAPATGEHGAAPVVDESATTAATGDGHGETPAADGSDTEKAGGHEAVPAEEKHSAVAPDGKAETAADAAAMKTEARGVTPGADDHADPDKAGDPSALPVKEDEHSAAKPVKDGDKAEGDDAAAKDAHAAEPTQDHAKTTAADDHAASAENPDAGKDGHDGAVVQQVAAQPEFYDEPTVNGE